MKDDIIRDIHGRPCARVVEYMAVPRPNVGGGYDMVPSRTVPIDPVDGVRWPVSASDSRRIVADALRAALQSARHGPVTLTAREVADIVELLDPRRPY